MENRHVAVRPANHPEPERQASWTKTNGEYVRQELDLLDQAEQVARDIIARDHPLIRNGQVVYRADGRTVQDPKPAVDAGHILNKIARSRARLLGTDPPSVVRLPPGASPADIDKAITETTLQTNAKDG